MPFKLSPCPMCGSAAKISNRPLLSADRPVSVRCVRCANGTRRVRPEMLRAAIDEWNDQAGARRV